ncbi:MAG: GNAT family N-acetyltransferase [Firmicutes bacterium]|nr:GNAT family N-acetyltransferase [Bacillota bacterium]
MDYKVEKAVTADYKKIIKLSNKAFHRRFKRIMPKLFNNRPEVTDHHYVIREKRKLVASATILPNDFIVGDSVLKSVGVGTVATAKNRRGKGFMTRIFKASEQDFNLADFAILTGKRKRYENYGFFHTGINKNYTFFKWNFKNEKDTVNLIPLSKCPEYAKEIARLNQEKPCFVPREEKDIQDILRTYSDKAFVVEKDGEKCGYLVFSWLELRVGEIKTPYIGEALKALFNRYKLMPMFRIALPVYDISNEAKWCEENAEFFSLNHNYSYKITNFKNMIGAYLKFKNSYQKLANGVQTIQIGEEILKISVKGDSILVEESQDKPDIKLSVKEAHLTLFGIRGTLTPTQNNWFPLPLYYPRSDNV